jgi:hypothetical protein
VVNLALKQPSDCLKTGVWMSGNHHAIGLLGWTKVINKHPGADLSKVGMRNAAPDLNPGSGGQLDVSRFDDHSGINTWDWGIVPWRHETASSFPQFTSVPFT